MEFFEFLCASAVWAEFAQGEPDEFAIEVRRRQHVFERNWFAAFEARNGDVRTEKLADVCVAVLLEVLAFGAAGGLQVFFALARRPLFSGLIASRTFACSWSSSLVRE